MKAIYNLTILVALIFFISVAVAQSPPVHSKGAQKLMDDTKGKAKIRVDKLNGNAKFVRFPRKSLQSSMITNTSEKSEKRAKAFFRKYGDAFGVDKPDSNLKSVKTVKDASGAEHSIFRQTHENVAVFGGELRAHFDSAGELIAVNGNFLAGLKLDMTPRLSAEQAAAVAISRVQDGKLATSKRRGDHREQKARQGVSSTDLSVFSNELKVFREGLLRGVPGADHLSYEVEVRNSKGTVREFVFVDAHNGQVIDQITGIHEAVDREVSETSLANVIWDESNGDPTTIPPGWAGGTAQQVTDWQNEIDASAETYNLFASMTTDTYQSYDGAGATMRTVNNDPGIACPNANWNGTSTNYCSGTTGDDTVAHEWGHAYTEYTSNLIYQWQSGALNESYSDIWGEVVDLLNGRGTDAPGGIRSAGGCSTFGAGAPSVDNTYRWLSGEDDPAFGGAIRDMWDPTCYGDPGKVTDTEYFCGTGDSGGVHFNSGVPNHAFALMVDGGNYNGQIITGLGLTKAAHIHWKAQNLLTPASNFLDQADALEAACTTLTGSNLQTLSTSSPITGLSGEIITADDCVEVEKINLAVEFRTPTSFCNFATLLDPDAPLLCEGVGAVQPFYSEDFEGGSLPAGWSVSSHDVSNPATFDTPLWSVTGGLPSGAGGSFAAFAPDLIIGDCAADDESGAVALDSPAIILPLGEVPHLAFDHWVATEADWDGGNLKVSVNGGSWTLVPSSAYSFNPYNDELNAAGNNNPLAGEAAFSGSDGGTVGGSWGQSQVDLYGLAFPGDSVELRFDLGVDGCNGLVGWYVDEVQAYSCSNEALPICGDGQLDLGEQCDDGNMANGDGCSNICQVDDGWICDSPTPGVSGTNVVNDGSFEAGAFGGVWVESSSNFGSPICSIGSCGTGTGTGPSDGDFWTWFGGIAASEVGSVSQNVVIPATATNLTFDLEQILCDGPDDYVKLYVDGDLLWTSLGSSALCGNLGYAQQTVDISVYADGGTHLLLFESEIFANNGSGSNFFVDNVQLSDNVAIPGLPSQCQMVVDDLACNAGIVAYDNGIPGSWTVTDNAGVGLIWTNVAGSGEGGNFTSGAGDAATVSSDRFGPAEFDTELRSNSFDLSSASSASLNYLVNYQNFAALDFLDVDISTDGGVSWANLLSWNEDHGAFRGAPGEAVSLDLSAYIGASDVQLRWRYYDPNFSDWDWYAQVDNVALSCNLVPDCAGATVSPKILWPPNHKWNAIDIDITDPDGDPVTVTVTSIFQDEGVKAKGTGNTSPDGRGVGTSTAEVRAERMGKGNGRVYHIGFTADDGKGGMCSSEILVGVPHDKGGQTIPVDDGALYDSTAN